MGPPTRRTLLRAVGVAGIGLLAGCAGLADGDADTPSEQPTGARSQPLSYGAAGGGCLPDPESVESGWIHTAAHGERYDVTFDVLIAHGRGAEASASLKGVGNRDFELVFSVVEAETDQRKTATDADCTVGSRLRGGGTVPADFRSLGVVSGEETVLTIQREGTGPRLHRVASPLGIVWHGKSDRHGRPVHANFSPGHP